MIRGPLITNATLVEQQQSRSRSIYYYRDTITVRNRLRGANKNSSASPARRLRRRGRGRSLVKVNVSLISSLHGAPTPARVSAVSAREPLQNVITCSLQGEHRRRRPAQLVNNIVTSHSSQGSLNQNRRCRGCSFWLARVCARCCCCEWMFVVCCDSATRGDGTCKSA